MSAATTTMVVAWGVGALRAGCVHQAACAAANAVVVWTCPMTTATLAASYALAVLLASPAATANSRSLEQRYLSARDEYARALAKRESTAKDGSETDRLFDDHLRALKELEGRLREVVGPVGVPGVTGPGAINLETLLRSDVGYGLLDGMRFPWGDDSLVVSTRGLVDAYARADGRLPRDLVALAKSPAFYQRGCMSDAAITHFVELPVRSDASMDVAKAFIAAAWQDIGPWPPDLIIAFVARGDRVYVITSQLKDRLDQFPQCDARWKEIEAKYDDARRPRAAGEQADPHPERHRDEAFEAYRRCYASALRTRASFADLTHRAQALVDRLSERR